MMNSDRIEKQIEIRAPRSRVWRALTTAAEFGEWFRAAFDGEFRAGETICGRILYPGYEHLTIELQIVRLEPEHTFVLRWHPYAVKPDYDYSQEPTTLIEFGLSDLGAGGTLVKVVESGFDALPEARRAEAFRMNDGGWAEQLENIQRHATRA